MSKPETDTILKCGKCGKTEEVNFQYCLTYGWKECCGQQMAVIETKADIKKAVKGCLEAQICYLCRKPATHRVSYTIPDSEKTELAVLSCYPHSLDLREALKWYLVSQGLWYPNCIKRINILLDREE